MADTSLIIGNGNWAVKETSLLGYNIIQSKYVPIEMTVSRATTATRVNSAGLIELVPRNLLTYSEQFDNASWLKTSTTITPNTTISPDGTLNADSMVVSTVDSRVTQVLALGVGAYTATVYVKILSQTTAGTMRLQANVDGANVSVTFTPTTEWQRVTATYNPAIGITTFSIRGLTFIGTIAIWGAQLETGTTATEYFPTTDRFNIPRVDYSTDTASLLVEPARTNSVLYSEQFNNALWAKTTLTVTANQTTAPDGNNTADLLAPTSSDSKISQGFLPTAAIQYNFSIYLRSATGSSFSTVLRITRDLPFANVASTTITVTTEWQRFNLTFTALDTTTHQATVGAGSELSTGENLYAWGAQVEAGSNATSYIPTVAGPISRNADVISKTGISSLIGQTEGTLYAEINITTFNNGVFFSINDGTSANRIQMYKFTDNKIYCDRISATQSVTTSINSSALSVGTYKVAFAYQSGNSYLYINGAQVGATSAATFTFGSIGKVNIGSRFDDTSTFNDRIKSAILFPTRLTPGQLATLTT